MGGIKTHYRDRWFFATAAKGTEGALRDELRELRMPKVRAQRGGVGFAGGAEHAMRACLRSRTALRVLEHVASFGAEDADSLYAGTAEVDWQNWIDASATLAVSAREKASRFSHTGFIAQRVKDAIVDRLRRETGRRPDVDRSDPDLHVVARITGDGAELFVDYAGRSLSRRGYRTEAGQAPVRETLAAAILRLSGFRPGTPLADPMCGSGTFAIEAAMWAQGIPAGGMRGFGFQRWRCFDGAARELWRNECERARRFADPVATSIHGSDCDPAMVRIAQANARRAGVTVEFEERALAELQRPPSDTLFVLNPPYGKRLEQAEHAHADLRRFLDRAARYRIAILSSDLWLPRTLGRRASAEHTLYNGDVECRLFRWDPA